MAGQHRGTVQRIVIPYRPRQHFLAYHQRPQRWAVMVCHRRAGKTVATVNDLIKRALTSSRQDARAAYIAPLYKQAKDVAWEYLKRFAGPIPGASAHESELRVDLPNGARVRLYGADNPDALRGIYLDDVVLDEYAQMRPSLWSQIIRPALADRQGSATFIGTPAGRNEFCTIWERAQGDPDWFSLMLKASASGLLPQAELDDARRSMTPDEYAQEFECSFDAAIKGAYYGEAMNQAQAEGRITTVAWEPKLLVHTAWDLGIGDTTAIWFFQLVGNEVRLIDFYEASGMGLAHYVDQIHARKARGWLFGDHYLPHDAQVRELGTGKSRVDTLRELQIVPRVLPALPVDDGISAARLLLPRCWFDRERCADGIEHLRQYRCEYDEKLRAFRPRPLHDIHSHACLTAEALVDTAHGVVPIADVRAGDRVWTPAGFALVEWAAPVGMATELIEITTEIGLITATPEHKFFTTKGLVCASELTESHRLLRGTEKICRRASSYSRAANIGFRAAIIGAIPGALPAHRTSIGPSGNTITARFRQAITSITGAGRGKGASGPSAAARNAVASFVRRFQAERDSAIRIVRLRRFVGAEAGRLVYDLTVERHHCYRANGILVSNSDAFRYLATGIDDGDLGQGKPRDRYRKDHTPTVSWMAAL